MKKSVEDYVWTLRYLQDFVFFFGSSCDREPIL